MWRGLFATKSHAPLLALILLMSNGCTIVLVDSGKVTQGHFGTLSIEPAKQTGVIAYRSVGIGLVPTLRGATLGFARETVAVVSATSPCHVILFQTPNTTESIAFWRKVLINRRDICLLRGKNE